MPPRTIFLGLPVELVKVAVEAVVVVVVDAAAVAVAEVAGLPASMFSASDIDVVIEVVVVFTLSTGGGSSLLVCLLTGTGRVFLALYLLVSLADGSFTAAASLAASLSICSLFALGM